MSEEFFEEIIDTTIIPEQWPLVIAKSVDFEVKITQKNEGYFDKTRLDKSHYLGEGATSKVFKTNSNNAVKIIDNKDYVQDPEGFSKEIDLLRKLNHPNIINVIGVGSVYPNNEKYEKERFEIPCVITEYLPEGLEEKIKNKSLTTEEIKKVFEAICSAIEFIYQETGEVVIDLEPAQIRFDKNNTPILNDLGYTANEKPGSAKNWSEFYTDPEVAIQGSANLQHTTHNLSLILWQCFTGKNIVENKIDNQEGIVPPKIFQLIEMGLKKSQDTRITTPLEFYKKLVLACELTEEEESL